MKHNYRQEVFNVLLAQLLQERGVITAPEDVLKPSPSSKRKMPDVLVDYWGLRIAIEGEVDDQPNYGEKALDSAKKRVNKVWHTSAWRSFILLLCGVSISLTSSTQWRQQNSG